MAEILDYKDDVSATLQPTCCPTCGQECEDPILRGNLWHQLTLFVATEVAKAQSGTVDVRKLCKQREKLLSKGERSQLHNRSTYRVAKGVLARAVSAGISLLRPNGNPKGKTQLEGEIAALRPH